MPLLIDHPPNQTRRIGFEVEDIHGCGGGWSSHVLEAFTDFLHSSALQADGVGLDILELIFIPVKNSLLGAGRYQWLLGGGKKQHELL